METDSTVESGWTLTALKQHYDERLDRRDRELDHRFDGFPQEYATLASHEILRTSLEAIRADHVQRREFDDVKKELDKGAGRRTAAAALASVVTATLVLAFGYFLHSGLTHADVAEQIRSESPWAQDKPTVESRLDTLERQLGELKLKVAAQQTLIQFLCRLSVRRSPGC